MEVVYSRQVSKTKNDNLQKVAANGYVWTRLSKSTWHGVCWNESEKLSSYQHVPKIMLFVGTN